MSKIWVQGNKTSKLARVFIQSAIVSNGSGFTGLTYSSSGLTWYYFRESASADVSVSPVSASLGTWTSGGFKEVDSSNMPGIYEIGLPNAMISTGAQSVVSMIQGVTNTCPCVLEIEITAVDNQSTGFGLSNASANVVQWNGTNVSSPATAGIPDVNVKNYNNQTAATDANNLPKVDIEDIKGAVISTGVAQLGVNLVNISGSTVATGTAQLGVNVVNISGSAVTTGVAQLGVNVVQYNKQTAVTDGNNYPSVNIVDINGAAASAGVAQLGVNLVNISGSAVSTTTAQLGTNVVKYNNQTAQTDANNLPKVDIEDIGGAAASTGVAQLGVNLVNISGSAVATGTAQLGVNVVNIGAATVTTGVAQVGVNVVQYNRQTAVTDGNNYPSVNIVDISGATASTGVSQLGVNVVKYNNQTAQTDGNNLPKVDVVDINGAAASVGVAQIGVNIVSYAASEDPATLVLGATASSWNTAGTIGQKINSAGSAGDPWTTVIPGAYTSGEAGYIVGNNLTGPVALASGVNVTQIAGSVVTTGVAQIGVNAVNIAGQAAQLDGNNLLKVDVVDINGSSASAGVAQLGVNAVQIGGVVPSSATIGTVTNVTNAVSITSNRKKGVQSTFEFLMQASSNGAPATGLTVAATISKDGGAPVATSNSVTEIGLGQYQIVLTASEMNANNIFVQMTAATAITSNISIQAQP